MSETTATYTLTEALHLFATVGMPARNLAKRTRQEYRHDLDDLLAFLAGRGLTTVVEVGLPDLEAYQAELDRRGYKASTRERKTYAIKTFFKWLHRQGLVAGNVASQLIPPRPQKTEPRYLSKSEYQALLRACSHQPRDAAIITVYLQTGMRLSELARLTLDDVKLPKRINRDPDNMGWVRVTRKGGKTKEIPLNYKACQSLAQGAASSRPRRLVCEQIQNANDHPGYSVYGAKISAGGGHPGGLGAYLAPYDGHPPRGRRDRSQNGAGDPGPRRSVHDRHLRVAGQAGPTQGVAGKCVIKAVIFCLKIARYIRID